MNNQKYVQELTGEVPEDEQILNKFGSQQDSNLDHISSDNKVEEIEDEPEEPPKNLPGIRQGGSSKFDFTEKSHPNMPARESLKKEPPYPKSKKLEKSSDDTYISIEDKDPVWLKDKGDHFSKR